MSEVKWIKITTDIFDDEKFDVIKTLDDKQMVQLAWVKLLCLAGKCNDNGFLTLTREIPYTDEMIANRFGMSIGDVKRSLELFQQLGMVELIENVYMVSNWLKYQNGNKLEEMRKKNNERQKKYREKQKELTDSKKSNVTCNVTHNVISNVFCSYSYSISYSNLVNTKILIDNNIYKDSIYILNNNKLYTCIKDWMEYKDARKPKNKHHYATEKGLKKLLTEIVNRDKEYGTDVVKAVIDRTMAAQYDGIGWFWLKEYEKKGGNDTECDTMKQKSESRWQ